MPDIEKFFGLFVDEQNGQVVHSMSTAVIGPDGKIYRWYHGNDWQTADVLQDVVSSLPNQAQPGDSAK
jgi:protein SCO1/2